MAETKIAKSNDARKKKDFLKKYLEEKRCATTRELAQASGIDKTTLRRLLLQLEGEGAAKSRRIGRVVLWCAP
jgi:predicted transcriptional regulator